VSSQRGDILSRVRHRLSIVVTVLLGCLVASTSLAGRQGPASPLKIVVIDGEGAVNIIQQKTAVNPIVEVRDRNNLPVAGASVTFSIAGGGQGAAFAGGLQTLTVTTNAAGQAAASGLNAVSSGTLQIQVQAAYQGQVATAAISQTNFATAAAATQAGAGAGGGGTATGATGGAAGGGGGGVSALTIGIIGAAVGSGALAATQVVGKGSDEEPVAAYTGSLTGQLIFTTLAINPQGQQTSCDRTQAVTGSMTIEMREGNATGIARMEVSQNEVSLTGQCIPSTQTASFTLRDVAASGGPSALTFTAPSSSGNTTNTVVFNGSLSGNTITGTARISIVQQGTGTTGTNASGSGSTTLQVTLQK
jgi:hypothetical protein